MSRVAQAFRVRIAAGAALLLTGCGSCDGAPSAPHAFPPDQAPSAQPAPADGAADAEAVAVARRPIDADSLRSLLAELPPDRYITAPGHAAARRFVLDGLAAAGVQAEVRPFTWDGAPEADLANLQARWPGETDDGPILIVSAHYDSVPYTPGADDNGSGTVVLLELARRCAPRAFASELRLVWFDAEEEGLLGAGAYVKALPEREARRIAGVINLETMGYTDRRAGSQRMPEGTLELFDPGDVGDFLLVLGNIDSRDLAGAVQDAMQPEQGAQFRSELFSFVPGAGWVLPDSRRSDHACFWDAGLPAVLLTDTANLRSPHYHAPSDTLQTLDLPFLAAAARGVERAVLVLARPRDG